MSDVKEENILTVSGLNRMVKKHLEGGFSDILLTGEISNYRGMSSSGHTYFSLKDENAQVSAVIWKYAGLRPKFKLEDGLKVIVRGGLNVYTVRGTYQVNVRSVEPAGKGALQLAFEQLKAKLEKEGLFSDDRKKPIPELPARIGIVTSPTGAAIRDMLSTLKRNRSGVHVLIYPVQVQGDRAKDEIAEAVRYLNAEHGELDVLLVGRGGGSLEDLWAFNEEVVARAIADSAIPVISCVGHEVDFTISDFVADLRVPTPTAAAEYIVKNETALKSRFEDTSKRLRGYLKYLADNITQRMKAITSSRVFINPMMLIEQKVQQVDETYSAIADAISHIFEIKSRDFRILAEKAGMLSPLNVLSRGYSITWKSPGNTILKNAASVSVSDTVKTRLGRGEITARVTGVKIDEEEN